MKRRDFLKALVASSALAICPKLNCDDIEVIDNTLNAEPLLFNVRGSQGELSLANYWQPPSRAAAYEINTTDYNTKDKLDYLAQELTSLRYEIYWQSEEITPNIPMPEDYDEESISDYISKLNDEEFLALEKVIQKWFEEPLIETDDDETAPYNLEIKVPLNGHSAAFRLFSHGGEFEASQIAELLNIEVIEGEHIYSTYYSAELRITVDEANDIAQKHDLPMRFVRI